MRGHMGQVAQRVWAWPKRRSTYQNNLLSWVLAILRKPLLKYEPQQGRRPHAKRFRRPVKFKPIGL